ncbi:MAG TPA: response regulator [Desulfobulbaceae bacterium]|nr:response regulator [Desulfobulbaceae bacterium]
MDDIKILLVDDEADFVSTLTERLSLRDMNSQSASSGEEALQSLGDNIPDIIVLDLKMPGIDGMEVLRRVKQYFPAIQVIILTGHGDDLDEAEARKLGAFDYLRKPVDIELLVSRIREAYLELKKSMSDSMSAVAYAEEGEFETAKKLANK